MLVGLATYPGVNQFVNASFGFTHGISPSVCSLAIAPQSDYFPIDGTLEFTFDDIKVEFPDCRVDTGRITRNAAGEVWQLSIMDRRWKWRWGRINGVYNIRNADGTIHGHNLPPQETTERTPQELAELCLEEMGESGYDIGDLPNKSRPEVRWNDAPAEALASLCDELGCHVVLRLDNTIKLCKVGSGNDLPTDGIISGGASVDPPDGPREMTVECGGNRYQLDLELEAVGVDNDKDEDGSPIGTIIPIDDLAYKPVAGWSASAAFFSPSDNVIDNDDDWELAKRSVYKMYRVVYPINVALFGVIDSIDHLIIESEQVTTKTENNIESNQPAVILGVWFGGTESLTNSAADTEYERSWSLDTNTGIVKFTEPVFKSSNGGAGGTAEAAEIKLRTAIQVRDTNTRALKRYNRTRRRDTPAETPARFYKHHELHLNYIDAVTPNQDDIDMAADHYLDAAEQEYQAQYPQSIRYMGLRRVDLDGAIQQISFNVTAGGTTTTISRNTEELLRVPSYKKRRRVERAREAPDTQKMVAKIDMQIQMAPGQRQI